MMLLLCLQCHCLLKGKKKSELLMDFLCFFLLSSLVRLSAVSVVFDFSASLNDVAPPFPKWKPVVVK